MKGGAGREENWFFTSLESLRAKPEHQSRQRVCIYIKVSYRHQHMLNRLLWTAVSAESKARTRTAMQTAAEHQQRERREARTALTVLSYRRLNHFSSLCIKSSLTSIFKDKYDCYKEQSSGGSSCERLSQLFYISYFPPERSEGDCCIHKTMDIFCSPANGNEALGYILPIMWHYLKPLLL